MDDMEFYLMIGMRKHLLGWVFAAVAWLLCAVPASAVTLISTATGNIGTTGTWSVVDTTGTNAFLNSETANTALTTSPVASSTFTPASETVTAIGVKLASVAASPSGTITVKLANSTSAGNRECTQTINVADLVTAAAATLEGGWLILTCSAVPNGTDAYTITANTSVSSQVNLFSLATTNWSRLLVTNGTQSGGPAAGDKFMVIGNRTGAGTGNSYTVTIDTVANVNYGNVANTLVDPLVVGQGGTLKFATAASTAYLAQFAGPLVVYNGGTFNIGTSGTPMPSTSSAVLTLNSTAEGDTGIKVRNGGTLTAVGVSGGRNVVKTRLTATATGGSTTALTTEDTTGWLSGDVVAVAGTASTNVLQDETKTLGTNASGTTLTIPSAFTNTHLAQRLNYTSAQTGNAYDFKMYPDLVLLNRNVKIQGGSTSNNGYFYLAPNATFYGDYVEFAQISGSYSAACQTCGFVVDVGPVGSFSLTNFSLHDSHNSALIVGAGNANFGGTSSNYMTFQNGSVYNVASISNGTQYGVAFNPAATVLATNPNWKVDNVAVIHAGGANFAQQGVQITTQGQVTNFSVANSGSGSTSALLISTQYTSGQTNIGSGVNTWGPITTYSNIGYAMSSGSYALAGKISGLYQWNEGGRYTAPAGSGDLIIDPFYQVQVTLGIYQPSGGGGRLTLRNGVQAYTATSTSAFSVVNDAKSNEIYFDNMELCPTGSSGTFGVAVNGCAGVAANGNNNMISIIHDVTPTGGNSPAPSTKVFLRNSSMLNGVTTNFTNQKGEEAWFGPSAIIAQDCAACTVNGNSVKHAAWVAGGHLAYDTAITHSSGYSLRMTPLIPTFSGYITSNANGTGTLTVTTAVSPATLLIGDLLSSNGSGFVAGTHITAGAASPFTVNIAQTVGSIGTPVQFQTYYKTTGLLPRMTSAPVGMGQGVAVASGQTANVCVWIRPSINTDGTAPWGSSAVTYNGDNPRLVVRQNPYMGVQADTVLGTSSPTAGAWSQFCANLPSAPADGQFEVVVDADQTYTSNVGGSVNVTEWSCTNCGSINGEKYWWNGTPMGTLAPTSLLVNPGMGGGIR